MDHGGHLALFKSALGRVCCSASPRANDRTKRQWHHCCSQRQRRDPTVSDFHPALHLREISRNCCCTWPALVVAHHFLRLAQQTRVSDSGSHISATPSAAVADGHRFLPDLFQSSCAASKPETAATTPPPSLGFSGRFKLVRAQVLGVFPAPPLTQANALPGPTGTADLIAAPESLQRQLIATVSS